MKSIEQGTPLLPHLMAEMEIESLERFFDESLQDKQKREVIALAVGRADWLYQNNKRVRAYLHRVDPREYFRGLLRHWLSVYLDGRFNGKPIPQDFAFGPGVEGRKHSGGFYRKVTPVRVPRDIPRLGA